MQVQLLDLKAQYATIKSEVKSAIDEVLESQHFILGEKVKLLEEKIAKYCDCKYALGVSSGTDALLLALMALDIKAGDIVITPSYSFFATAGCVARLGAEPLFVDIDLDTFNISADSLQATLSSLSKDKMSRVKAVIPVHLFGQMSDMVRIKEICDNYGLRIIEDAAQAIGAECNYKGEVKRAGSIGDIGCFSFFPSKNLGGIGDGGMVVTNSHELYERMKILRSHGASPKYYHKFIGGNFRLDEIQAAVLLVKLNYLDKWTSGRQKNAHNYNELLVDLSEDVLLLPEEIYDRQDMKHNHIYNQYCIRVHERDRMKSYLKENGVDTEIYYPLPLHLQECFNYLVHSDGDFPKAEIAAKESLALPVFPELTEESVKYIAKLINEFPQKNI